MSRLVCILAAAAALPSAWQADLSITADSSPKAKEDASTQHSPSNGQFGQMYTIQAMYVNLDDWTDDKDSTFSAWIVQLGSFWPSVFGMGELS